MFDLSHPSSVQLSILNLSGQQVYAKSEPFLLAGRHAWAWKPGELSSGVYFCRIQAGSFTDVAKMMLVK